MAWYYGTYSCGHEGRVNVIGKVKDRQWKIDRHFEGVCPECWETEKQKRFDEANAKAAAEAAEYGLPELTGTEKQAAWANTLRQNWIEIANNHIESTKRTIERFRENRPDAIDAAEAELQLLESAVEYILKSNTAARYWIDNRGDNVSSSILEVAKKIKEEKSQPPVPEAVKKEVIEEMTIRPSEATMDLVTDIRIKDTVISAKLPEKDEDFRKVVKDLRFEWKEGKWQRDINSETKGALLDRATELGIKLLAAGFPIRVYQDDLHQQIIAGTYEPECDRWIMAHENGFRIWWHRDEGDFYNEAKRLPGSRWLREKRSMYVPKEAFRDLQGFAEQYQFSFTQAAQENLIKAAKNFEDAMVLDVAVPKKEQLPEPGCKPEKLQVEEFGIDESLKEG